MICQRPQSQCDAPRRRRSIRVCASGLLLWLAACAHPDAWHGKPNQPQPTVADLLISWLSPNSGDADPPETQQPREDEALAFLWPVEALGVTSPFGARLHPVSNTVRFHYGVDLEILIGDPVVAPAGGIVTSAGWAGAHGYRIVIDHPHGYTTSYSHLSEIRVRTGEEVQGGELVGLTGNTGRSTGPHLHLEVIRFGAYLNPIKVLGAPLAITDQTYPSRS